MKLNAKTVERPINQFFHSTVELLDGVYNMTVEFTVSENKLPAAVVVYHLYTSEGPSIKFPLTRVDGQWEVSVDDIGDISRSILNLVEADYNTYLQSLTLEA
jgi:hypothetical protein